MATDLHAMVVFCCLNKLPERLLEIELEEIQELKE